MLQSPRSGKIESNKLDSRYADNGDLGFNPLDRGKLNQIGAELDTRDTILTFQSPRSGKIESNLCLYSRDRDIAIHSFNPLDRGKLNQISLTLLRKLRNMLASFNPLDRGNLNQI